jgi:hypothetical protein
VEIVPGTDVTIIIQAQSSAWRWNIGITQVSQVQYKVYQLPTICVIVCSINEEIVQIRYI